MGRNSWFLLPGRPALATAGRWALFVLMSAAALVGIQHLTRGTSVRHVHGVGADGHPVAPGEPQFPATVAMLSGAALRTGHVVEIALNGDGTFDRLWADIRSARESITLQLYYGQPGRLDDTLQQVLVERAAAGVRVYLLYDAFGFQSMPSRHRTALRAAGISAVPFRPVRLRTLHLAQNRSHVRGIVIDGRIGWTGGFGIDDKWLGDGRTSGSWRETNVRFEGPAVQQLQGAFAAAWAEATGTLLSGRTAVAETGAGPATAGLLYAAPAMGSTSAERFLAMTLAGSRRTLFVTNSYFAPDDNFTRLLAEAAQRGVDVRILTGGPRSDVTAVRWAGRAQYGRLLAAGVRIYEWQPTTLHAKTFVADGVWATIGSMNFDNRSLTLNDESTLMILDETIGARMNAIFMEDLRHAEEITLAAFRRRSWTERVLEMASSILRRVL